MLGVLCPGQGAQDSSMLDLLTDPPARGLIDQAGLQLGLDLWALVTQGGDPLFRNATSQPLICAAQFAAWSILKPFLPRPRVFAGYSIGELGAYGCAGSLDLADLVMLAQARAHAMDQACTAPNGLIAVRGIERGRLTDLAKHHKTEIAIANATDRLVVGGLLSDLTDLTAELERIGGSVTPLQITVASHTSLMEPAKAPFEAALQTASFDALTSPVLAGIDGSLVSTAQHATRVLVTQLSQTIEWSTCLDRLQELGCTVLLELGPGDTLSRMAQDRFPDLPCRSVTGFRSLAGVAQWVERQLS